MIWLYQALNSSPITECYCMEAVLYVTVRGQYSGTVFIAGRVKGYVEF